MTPQRPGRFYLLGFFGLFLALYAIYHAAEPALLAYYSLLAQSVCWLFGAFDPAVGCQSNYLLYAGVRELVVVEGCDGITFFVLLIAAVVPFPASWRSKVLGLLWLLPAVFVLNWARLAALAAVRFYLPAWFDPVHVYLFQPLMIAVTLAAFLGWTLATARRAPA